MGKQGIESRHFTRDAMAAALAFSVLLAGVVTYFSVQAERDVSEQYIHDETDRAVGKLGDLKSSIETSLKQIRDYGESGLVSLSKPDELKKLLLPVLKEKLLSGITIADTDGRNYFIQPDGSERKPSDAGGFDPKTRPWFRSALKNTGIHWSRPYLFHTLQQAGVTASVAYSPPKGKGRVVVAFDILLTDLYREIEAMAPSANSELFTIHSVDPSDLSSFVLMDSAAPPFVRKAFSLWQNGAVSGKAAMSFQQEGKVWWCGFQQVEGVWIGVVVPESDIVGDAGRRRLFLWGFGLVSIAFSLGLAFWVSRRYSRSFATHAFDPDSSEETVRALIAKGENRAVEFKSTLRMNLHAKKPGKEIELAWLKGVAAFLNTDGGTLLLGVTDDGEITGLERDVFENNDKCRLHFKNLIANHIGAEFSKHIRFSLVPVDGKTVGVVQCARSSEPVFLKNGNKEAFHIRNGPSSDELPVSKALDYIKHRK